MNWGLETESIAIHVSPAIKDELEIKVVPRLCALEITFLFFGGNCL